MPGEFVFNLQIPVGFIGRRWVRITFSTTVKEEYNEHSQEPKK